MDKKWTVHLKKGANRRQRIQKKRERKREIKLEERRMKGNIRGTEVERDVAEKLLMAPTGNEKTIERVARVEGTITAKRRRGRSYGSSKWKSERTKGGQKARGRQRVIADGARLPL